MTPGRSDASSSAAGERGPVAGGRDHPERGWHDGDQVAEYLGRVHALPARRAGEEVLAELLEEPASGLSAASR